MEGFSLARFLRGPNAWMVAALSAATIALIGAAAIGAREAQRDAPTDRIAVDRPTDTGPEGLLDEIDDPAGEEVEGVDATAAPGARAPRRGTTGGGGGGGTTGGTPTQKPSEPGATREGILADHFKYGVHAPLTIDGAPLNLAENPVIGLKGYITYINREGGINGRKIRMFLEDDRYTTQGGAQARDKLVKEVKPFFISGTLGVDQINIVAKAAGEAGIPYMAIGGPEPEWRTMGMYQVGSSYDQYMDILAGFICAHGKSYVGEDEVRLGTTTLDTPFILPVEARFVDKLQSRGCVAPVDGNARGKVRKPTEQQTYQSQLLRLRNAYGGKGVNLIVPLQDPVTTSRQVAENRPYKGPDYNPKWTFSNFAHDSDTNLTLMGGEWTGVRGLTGACYYMYEQAYNTSLCAQMKAAHERWVSLGYVRYDENAGGCAGGRCEFDYNENTWVERGSGGAAGYQLVHFFLGAMKATGADPTREKFVAALNAYDRYSDLITTPITFKGSPNIMRGASGAVVIEGQANRKFRQVAEITPGLVEKF